MRPFVLVLVCLALCSCKVQDQAMRRQKKYVTYAPSALWRDGAAARPLPDHVIPTDVSVSSARPRVTDALIARGRQVYEIYCTPCHGYDGSGGGTAVARGFPQPPSYHSDRLLGASAQHFFDVITNGYGVMYPYRSRVQERDRWAIIAYIRALQLTQLASTTQGRRRTP